MQQPTFLPSDNPRVPKAEYPFRHHMPVQIRFTDIDMLGHLNNNVYLTFMDLAKVDYFSVVSGEMPDMHAINMVVVHIDIDFFAPTFFGEEIEVWTTVTAIGNRSLRLEQRIVSTDLQQTKSVGTVVMSGFDPATNRSLPIEQRWIDAIAAFEQRTYRV